MPNIPSCPSTERLRQLLTSTAPEEDQADLIAHLDHCASCQHTLEQLAGADQVLLQAAGSLQRTVFLEESALQRVLRDLEEDDKRTVLDPSENREWVRSLLQPVASLEGLGQFDHYEVTELLGQGSMGLVLKAFDPALKRWVAIKVLLPHLASDSVARQRFAREAQAAAAIRHPHVITIHTVSESQGLPFLVMEYVAGGSLQDYLDEHGPPEGAAIARLGAQIASGLAAAHAEGLVHRDIKPSNILLHLEESSDGLGLAKIGDFGLARVVDEVRLTQPGIVAGTPMYMAPEQALCEEIDARADLFSLGSVLYTLCTGREPFRASRPVAVLRQVCEATPAPIREFNPDIPLWLSTVIERLHAKRPADRFASAVEVAEVLRYNLEHPEQPRVVPLPAVDRPRRIKRRLMLGAVALALLLAGALGVSEGFHWTHWLGAFHGTNQELPVPRATLRGHNGPVWSVAFAPDGHTVVTGGDDASVRLWDAATGQERANLPAHDSPVMAVAFANSGKVLVSGGGDGALRLWNVSGQEEESVLLQHNGSLRRLAISPDGKTLAVNNSTQGIELWDLEKHTLRLTLGRGHGSIWALTFAPDGRTLAVADNSGDIRLWDPATGTEQGHFQGDPFSLRGLAFAPDSRTFASAGTGDVEVKLWDTATHRQIGTLTGPKNIIEPGLFAGQSPPGRQQSRWLRDPVGRGVGEHPGEPAGSPGRCPGNGLQSRRPDPGHGRG